MWYTKYGPTTMQGWKGCDQLQTNQTITLTDARDNNQYTVAKLLDGKCWMTQNLKIQGPKELTPEDSDLNNNFNLPASQFTIGNTFSMEDTAYVYIENTELGGFYSWFTATAGEGTVAKARNKDYNAAQSICPRGWDLPTTNDYEELSKYYTYDTIQQSPANFIRAGEWVKSGVSYRQPQYYSPTIGLYKTASGLGSGDNTCGTTTGRPAVFVVESSRSLVVRTFSCAMTGQNMRCIYNG